MKLEEWLYYDACRHLDFDEDTTPFHSIEIWVYKVRKAEPQEGRTSNKCIKDRATRYQRVPSAAR